MTCGCYTITVREPVTGRVLDKVVKLCPECTKQKEEDDMLLEQAINNDTSNWGAVLAGRYIHQPDGSIEINEAVVEAHEDTDVDDWLDCDLPWD